jgi:hypothetical protein
MDIANRHIVSSTGLIAVLAVIALAGLRPAAAQTAESGAITGVVRDPSGATLPGVTVEAASPSLIEQARTATTDDRGVFRIVNLRPGTYKVTFTLAGFSTHVREGIELSAAFTATVNAELMLGELAETVTVSGQAPIVDTQGVESREVFSRAKVDALPIALSTGSWAALIPAMKGPPTSDSGASGGVDVGGTQSERTQSVMTVHGGTDDVKVIVDGVEVYRGVSSMNRLNAEEVNVQMSGNPAESETGGVRISMVAKEGGNNFSGSLVLDGTTGALQSGNVGDDLRARGVTGSPTVKRVYNAGGSLGGRIVLNRLWFFGSFRKWDSQQWLPDKFHNASQGTPVFTPGEPAHTSDYYQSISGRITLMATSKQKVNVAYEDQSNCNCVLRLIAQNRAPEATGDHTYRQFIPSTSWNYTASNRLLFEAGASWFRGRRENRPVRGVLDDHIAIRERSTGFLYNARGEGESGATGWYGQSSHRENISERFNVSFVTGSHNFKTGVLMQQWPQWEQFYVNGGMRYDLQNGVPLAVTLYASPDARRTMAHNLGVFVQDQWTMGRLTANIGLRFDHYRGHARENVIPAGPFVPERRFAKTDDLVNWKDLNPRVGVAYDLFGSGRTALKGFLGRFIYGEFGGVGSGDPAASMVRLANRTWTDRNGDFVPQADELGPLDNVNFGNPVAAALTVDEAVSFGWGHRQYTWQGSVSIQHELRQGLGVSVGYFRTSHGNLTYDDNLRVGPEDFDPYCIVAPSDSRLPSGAGERICGLFDVDPAKFGLVETRRSLADGLRSRVFNGIDANVNTRWNRLTLSGGIASGNTVVDDCGAAVDSPQALRFCRQTFVWGDDLQVKVNGSYSFPLGISASVVYQNVPGFPVTATHVVSNAAIVPSLGRNLSAGARGTASVELIEPNTMFEDRTSNLDLRMAKRFQIMGAPSATVNLDIYNVMNANTPQHVNTAYGPQWLRVLNVMSGRLVRFGVQVDF